MESYQKVEMADFYGVFEQMKSQHSKIILIFKGSVDPVTHENWCSDCVKAEGAIKEVVIPESAKQGIPVIECAVGDRQAWMDKSHALRVDPVLKVGGVPTIIYYWNNKVVKRLEEELCMEKDLLEEFMQE